MPNPQKNSEELLPLWNQLKPKLTKLTYLLKKKELIKDALEVHLNQASSFTSPNNQEYLSYLTRKKESFTAELNKLRSEGIPKPGLEFLKSRLTEINQMLDRTVPERQAFIRQKEKNERIVRECKELLERLGE